MTDDLKLSDLGNYYATERYHNVMGTNVTDGIAYIMNNGYSWFVTDQLIAAKMDKKCQKEAFLVIKLKVDLDKHTAIATIEDGNNKVLRKQEYEYTNAQVKELTLYFTDGVLLLSGEY